MIGFVVCHMTIVSAWSVLGLRLHALSTYLQQTETQYHQTIKFLASYIAWTGSDQYWDFFAPAHYDKHLSLQVCAADRLPKPGKYSACPGTIVYRSDGSKAAHDFQVIGDQRSRSYRFSEQLFDVQQESAYEKILRYWDKRAGQTPSNYLFLIAQHRPIRPAAGDAGQTDTIIWAIERR